MLLAGTHGLCEIPVGNPSGRAGGAEREMWPSEMGELEGKLDGLVQAQLCQEFPSASAGVALWLHKEQRGLFPSNSPWQLSNVLWLLVTKKSQLDSACSVKEHQELLV